MGWTSGTPQTILLRHQTPLPRRNSGKLTCTAHAISSCPGISASSHRRRLNFPTSHYPPTTNFFSAAQDSDAAMIPASLKATMASPFQRNRAGHTPCRKKHLCSYSALSIGGRSGPMKASGGLRISKARPRQAVASACGDM